MLGHVLVNGRLDVTDAASFAHDNLLRHGSRHRWGVDLAFCHMAMAVAAVFPTHASWAHNDRLMDGADNRRGVRIRNACRTDEFADRTGAVNGWLVDGFPAARFDDDAVVNSFYDGGNSMHVAARGLDKNLTLDCAIDIRLADLLITFDCVTMTAVAGPGWRRGDCHCEGCGCCP